MVDKIEAPDPATIIFRLKFATAGLPAGPCRPVHLHLPKGYWEKFTRGTRKTSSVGPFKFVLYETGKSINGPRNPDFYREGLPYLDGFTGIFADNRRCGSRRSAATAPRWSSAACRRRRATSWWGRSATR